MAAAVPIFPEVGLQCLMLTAVHETDDKQAEAGESNEEQARRSQHAGRSELCHAVRASQSATTAMEGGCGLDEEIWPSAGMKR